MTISKVFFGRQSYEHVLIINFLNVVFLIGRGLGGVIGYVGLTFLSKDLLLKILSLAAVFICVLYLMIHYWCLKSSPYTRQYDFDKPATYGK